MPEEINQALETGRPIPTVDQAAWDNAEGQEYGGQSDILKMKVGEIAGPLVYVGHQQIETDLGSATVHLATDEEEEQWRLPISATFIRCVDQANLKQGDTFLVRRLDDQQKKRGKGKGNAMAIFALKVTQRVKGNGVPF